MYIIQAPLLKLKKKYASLNFSNYRNIYVTIFYFKKKTQKYLCGCVYNIYTYIFIHIQFMFSCWMYFYEILTRTKTNRHSISMLLITYKFLNNTVSFYLQFKWEGRCVSVGGVCTHTPRPPASHLLWRKYFFSKSSSFGFAFSWFSIRSTGQKHWWQFICITNQLLGFLVCFFLKQLFETTTGILSIISWKFVVVCLKYNWLYTIVLTFQTALSTFILITHLCIDFFFFFF